MHTGCLYAPCIIRVYPFAREYSLGFKDGDRSKEKGGANFEGSARVNGAARQQEVPRMSGEGYYLCRHDHQRFCLHGLQRIPVRIASWLAGCMLIVVKL